MASSGNFATINFQAQSLKSTVTPTLGNLKFDGSTLSPGNYEGGIVCNFGMKSGKWYWETYLSGGGTPNNGRDWNVGFAPYSTASKSIDEGTYGLHLGNGSSSTLSGYGYTQYPAGTMGIRHNNSTSSFGSAHSSGDILGHALDLDNGTYIIYKNGSSLGTAATGIDTSFTYFAAGGVQGGTISSFDVTWNFGQDSTFGGAVSAGGNSDGNGFGDFKYSVPSGYLACSTANLSVSDDIDPAQTDDDFGEKLFSPLLYTGNGSNAHSITGLGFKPDIVWLKKRSSIGGHQIFDSSRGVHKLVSSDNDNLEYDASTTLQVFGSDGFTLGTSAAINGSSANLVAWCWRLNGGVTASNSEGDISSTTQASDKTGCSVVLYTGNGSQGQSIGHGLTKAPEMVWFKNRSNTTVGGVNMDWIVALSTSTGSPFASLSGSNQTLELNNGDAYKGKYRTDGNFTPTTSTFSVPNNGNAPYWFNASSNNYVAYCWHSVEGFSKFGFYTGNANDDGPFIYTGFRPAMVFLKNTAQSSSEWSVHDSARNTFNPVDKELFWNGQDAEGTGKNVDFLSNGFKIRKNTGAMNNEVQSLFGAWGSTPFKYNNTF